MRNKSSIFGAIIVVASLATLLGGCATENYSAQTYRTGLVAQRVKLGHIISVKPVVLAQPNSANTAGAVGAVGGAILGSRLGGASNNYAIHSLGALGGAVLGGLAGQAVGNNMSRQFGQLITVRLDNGRLMAVTQATTPGLYVGERVQVLYSPDGNARVLPFSG